MSPALNEGIVYRTNAEARKILDEGKAVVATPTMYLDWLEGYIKNGGAITNVHNYPLEENHVMHRIEESTHVTLQATGASVRLLVPEGVDVIYTKELLGASQLFFMGKDARVIMSNDTALVGRTPWVPVLPDVLEEMKTRKFFLPVIDKLQAVMDLIPEANVCVLPGGKNVAREKQQILLQEVNDLLRRKTLQPKPAPRKPSL